MQFLNPIPNSNFENSEEEYNHSVEKMLLERIKNSKPDDYVHARESLQRSKIKYDF